MVFVLVLDGFGTGYRPYYNTVRTGSRTEREMNGDESYLTFQVKLSFCRDFTQKLLVTFKPPERQNRPEFITFRVTKIKSFVSLTYSRRHGRRSSLGFIPVPLWFNSPSGPPVCLHWVPAPPWHRQFPLVPYSKASLECIRFTEFNLKICNEGLLRLMSISLRYYFKCFHKYCIKF